MYYLRATNGVFLMVGIPSNLWLRLDTAPWKVADLNILLNSSFSVLYLIARFLKNKLNEVDHLVNNIKETTSIIAVTDAWNQNRSNTIIIYVISVISMPFIQVVQTLGRCLTIYCLFCLVLLVE